MLMGKRKVKVVYEQGGEGVVNYIMKANSKGMYEEDSEDSYFKQPLQPQGVNSAKSKITLLKKKKGFHPPCPSSSNGIDSYHEF